MLKTLPTYRPSQTMVVDSLGPVEEVREKEDKMEEDAEGQEMQEDEDEDKEESEDEDAEAQGVRM